MMIYSAVYRDSVTGQYGVYTDVQGDKCLYSTRILKISPPKTESFQIESLIFFICLLKT